MKHISLGSEMIFISTKFLSSSLIVAALVCGAAKIAQVLCIFGKLPPSPTVLPLFLIVARRGFVNQSDVEVGSTLFKSRLVYFLPEKPTLRGATVHTNNQYTF